MILTNYITVYIHASIIMIMPCKSVKLINGIAAPLEPEENIRKKIVALSFDRATILLNLVLNIHYEL